MMTDEQIESYIEQIKYAVKYKVRELLEATVRNIYLQGRLDKLEEIAEKQEEIVKLLNNTNEGINKYPIGTESTEEPAQ